MYRTHLRISSLGLDKRSDMETFRLRRNAEIKFWIFLFLARITSLHANEESKIHPPVIENNTKGEMIISAGETLSLTCRGIYVLYWLVPHSAKSDKRITEKQKIETVNNKTTYVRILQILNTTYKDTSHIICLYRGITENYNMEGSTSIYVYVFNPHHLFLEDYYLDYNYIPISIMMAAHNLPQILCRTSHPDVNVTLVKTENLNTMYGKQITVDPIESDDVLYNPRYGYLLLYPNRFFSGFFECLGKFENLTQNISLLLLNEVDTSRPPVPYIIDDNEDYFDTSLYSYILLNDTFRLSCRAYVDEGTSLSMNWKYPNNTFGTPHIRESELTYQKKISSNGSKYGEYIRNLTVQNAMISDSGLYSCIVADYINETNYLNLEIKVFNGFAIKALHDDEVVETTTFTLTCGTIDFTYSSLDWKWKPRTATSEHDYLSLESRDGFEIIRESNGDTNRVTLKMESIDINKSGEYVCIGKRINAGREDKRSRIVEVKAIVPPEFTTETNLNGSIIHIDSREDFTLKCKVRGTPPPQITWLKDGQRLNNTIKHRLIFTENKTVLTIEDLRKKDTGLYTCQAENLGGNASVNLSIQLIGDVPTDFIDRDEENESSWTIYLIISIVVISKILFVLLGCFIKKVKEDRVNRREMEMISQALFKHGDPHSYNPDLPLDDQVELLPYDKRWEFPKERLKLGKTLGQGAFGRVVKAKAIGLQAREASTIVAVKMLKQHANLTQKKALTQELKVMIHLGRHLNVLNLLGAVTKNIKKGELLVIVEYCRYGNLRHFLLSHRDHFIDSRTRKINHRINEIHNLAENSASEIKAIEDADDTISEYKNSIASSNVSDFTVPNDRRMVKMSMNVAESNIDNSSGKSIPLTSYKEETRDRKLTTRDLLCYSFQVARGMEYLSSRKLVHRDLAARNILLADDNVVKICDFGLAKDLYKYSNYKRKGNGPLPIKWMALESIRDKVFSFKSDVWSFGIVLWEFFTLGGNPYPGIEIDEEFYKKLKSGYRMNQPKFSTAEVYEIMQSCWLAEPKHRPTFTELVDRLGSQLEASVREHYVDLNNPYMIMNRSNNDYLTMDTPDDMKYININYDIIPPLSPSDIQVPSRPRDENINSDYLSMQSPILTNCHHTNSPFYGHSNVEKVHPDIESAIELTALTLSECPEDPHIPRDLYMTYPSDQSTYLFMGNRDSNCDKKMQSGSGSNLVAFSQINR